MASNDQDLKFKLTVEPDTSKAHDDIKALGREMDEQAKKAKQAWDAFQNAGQAQLEKIQGHNRFAAAFNIPELIDVRGVQLKSITAEMDKQRGLLEKINVELEPSVLQKRVALEKQLSDARAKYKDAYERESASQNPQEVLPVKGLIETIASRGLNLRQLAGSALGGAIGGGQGGALGAAAGGLGIEALSGELGAIGVAAGVAAGGLLLVKDMLARLTGTIEHFAAVASPAAAYRWEYTFRDLEGVIGQRLVPVLDAMTVELRGFADLLDAILPSASNIKSLTNDVKILFDTITLGVLQSKSVTQKVFKDILEYTTPLALLGGGGKGDSFGAAARPARFEGIEEYEKGFQQSALSASSMQSIPEKQLNVLEKILDAITGKSVSAGQKAAEEKFWNRPENAGMDPLGIHRVIFGH